MSNSTGSLNVNTGYVVQRSTQTPSFQRASEVMPQVSPVSFQAARPAFPAPGRIRWFRASARPKARPRQLIFGCRVRAQHSQKNSATISALPRRVMPWSRASCCAITRSNGEHCQPHRRWRPDGSSSYSPPPGSKVTTNPAGHPVRRRNEP